MTRILRQQDVHEVDPYDVRFARTATGLLREFNQAGVLSAADVHVARRLGRLGDEADERVLLAAALAVRAVRFGAVCIDLAEAATTVAADEDLRTAGTLPPWPDPRQWSTSVAASPLVTSGADPGGVGGPGRPLRLVDGLLYLERYWRDEQLVRVELDARASSAVSTVGADDLRRMLADLFPGPPPDRQRLAAALTALRRVTVLVGGPGTGKTTTVARLLALLRALPGGPPRVALAAPTGKAAARLREAIDEVASVTGLDVGDAQASTLHRLLGRRPDSQSRFRHDRHNRLPHDVVIVDETSMVSLSLMARLLEAVRPDARLVLVGDPDQLASVEAGAVLGDLVVRRADTPVRVPAGLESLVAADLEPGETGTDAFRNGVVRLTYVHRFGGAIAELAAAVKAEDPDRVVEILRSGSPDIEFVELEAPSPWQLDTLRQDVLAASSELVTAARIGDVAGALGGLQRHRLLCAHRHGPYGVARWSAEIERWTSAAEGPPAAEDEWYVGRPLLATANDYEVQLFNGDTGVVVDHLDRGATAAFARSARPLLVSPNRLSGVQTVHAMTVHRAQGSQFERVSLLLPDPESPLLTRELFYTAITRAQHHVRVIGSADAVRAAVGQPIVRASGLGRRR